MKLSGIVRSKHSVQIKCAGFLYTLGQLEYGEWFLRNVLEGVPQLNAQVLDVAPLAFLHRLSRQLDVVHRQLGLVIQPLDHKDRACMGTMDSEVRRVKFILGYQLGLCN